MFLERILRDRRRALKERTQEVPLALLEQTFTRLPPCLDLASALRGERLHLIGEIKRASPSRGILAPHLDADLLARTYADNGVAAISVLTEPNYFLGSLADLRAARKALGATPLPLLCKDFVLEPYQAYEARANGADAILLIASILSTAELRDLLSLARKLGMQALVEVHAEPDLECALETEARIIGINNRDLSDFSVDLATTKRLRPLIPPDRIVVSESGIASRAEVELLRDWGVDAILVGEALVTASNLAAKIKEFSL